MPKYSLDDLFGLAGRTAVITGAAGVLCGEMARALAELGVNVAILDLREDAAQITSFLEQIRRCRPTIGKPVIAGYDEGADLGFLLAVQQPDLVSTVIMAGGMPDVAAGLPTAPVLGLHGVKDDVVPYDAARNAYHGLIAAGAPVRFLRMFGVSHSFAGALQIKLWHEAARALDAIQATGG